MERDFDVIKSILESIEGYDPKEDESDKGSVTSDILDELDDVEPRTAAYHLGLLFEEDYVRATPPLKEVEENLDFSVPEGGVRLTWDGHDLLDELRDSETNYTVV